MRFLTVLQGHCYNDDKTTCPKVTLYSASGPTVVTREAYLTGLAGLPYESRWPELGWLAFIAAFFATVTFLSMRFLVWQRK